MEAKKSISNKSPLGEGKQGLSNYFHLSLFEPSRIKDIEESKSPTHEIGCHIGQ